MTQDLFAAVDTSGQNDIDVQFTNVRFGTNIKYMGGEVALMLFDQVDENGQVREDQILTIGKGLKIVDGGARVEYVNGRLNKGGAAVGLPKGSKAATLLDTLVPLGLEAFKAKLAAGVGPTSAGFWEGISFHLVNEDRQFSKAEADGTFKTYQVPTATAFYGWDGIPADGGVEATATATATSTIDLTSIEAGVLAQLKALAAAHSTFTDFVAAAYELDAIADPAVQAVVEDEAGFAALKA